jgi:hypothetical protein
VHLKLEGLVAALACNLDNVVEFALSVGLKLDVESNGEAGGNTAEIFIVAAELLSLRPAELDAPHVLRQVAHRHCNFVVLVWLDV